MPRLLRAKGWGLTRPPPGILVASGHPLAIGLQNALLLSEQGGSVTMDSLRDRLAAITYAQGTPAWTGDGLSFNGTVSGNSPEQVNVDPGLAQTTTTPGPATLLASVRIAGNTSGGIIGIENGDIATNGSSNVRGIWMGIGNSAGFSNGAAGVNLSALNENVAWQPPGSGIVIPTGQWVQIALLFPGFSATSSFYVNGLLKGTTNFGGAANNSSTPMELMVGGYFSGNGSVNRVFTGNIRYAYHWNRLLTPAELEWLAIEPFAFFAPPPATRSGISVTSSITVTAARGNGRAAGRPATVTATTPVAGARGSGRAFGRPATITTGLVLTAARGVGRGVGRPAGVTGSASVTGARGVGRATGRPATITTGVVVTGARGVGRSAGRSSLVSGSAAVAGARGRGRSAGRPATITTGITVLGARGFGRAAGRPGFAGTGTLVIGARAVGRATGRHATITTSSVVHAARGFGRAAGVGATITVPPPPAGAPGAYGIPAYGVPPYAGGVPGGAGPALFDVTSTASVVVTSKASAFQVHPPPEPVPGPFGLHDYEVIVVDKYGIAQGQIVSAIPTQIDWVLNDLGQALIDFYILDPSSLLLPLSVLPGAREIQIWRDQCLIWWGWPTSVTYDAKQVHLTCSGLLFPYSKRSFGPITTNYLLNADFELPATLNVIPDWTAINCTANVTPANAVASPLLNSFMAQLQQPVPGEDAYIRQYVNVTNGGPGGSEGTFYDLSAWVYIDPTATFAPAFGQNGIFIQFIELESIVAGPEIQQITVDTGAGQWVRLECGVEVPPNASGVLEIRLYAPQGVTYWDACRLTVQESVGSSIAGDDVQFIMEQIVTYAQDATKAKSDLAMPFVGPATGTVLERVYQFSDNSGILDALNEFPTIGVCDFEVTWDNTGHFRQFQIFPPAKGDVKYNYPITVDIPSTTDLEGGIDGTLVATTCRVLGQGSSGSSQDIGWAAFPSALGGRVALDGIFTQGSNVIQSDTIGFTDADIGEGVYCQQAGVLPIGATIDSIIDSSHCTFTSNQGGGALLNANGVLGIGGIVLDDVESALPDLPIGTLQGTAEGVVLRQAQTQFLPTARQRADGPNGLFGNVATGDVVPVMFNYGWLTYGPVMMRVATLSLYPPTEELEVQLNVVPIGENAYG